MGRLSLFNDRDSGHPASTRMFKPSAMRSAAPRKRFAVPASRAVLLAALMAPGLVLAQQVVVTGTRNGLAQATTSIGARVFSGDEIRRSGASDLIEALRKLAGIDLRRAPQSSQRPDLRVAGAAYGAGAKASAASAASGANLPANAEQGDALLSLIPLENVERVEVSGSGAVKVVTRQPAAGATHGELFSEAGEFDQRDNRLSLARNRDGLSLDGALEEQRNGNYRDGSDFRQHSFSGGAEWKVEHGRFGFSADSVDQDTRYPAPPGLFSSITALGQRPDDLYAYNVRRASAFVQRYIGNIDLGLEVSQREKNASTSYVGDNGGYVSAYDSRQWQISPRVRHYGKWGGATTDTELGIDLMQWQRRTASVTPDETDQVVRRQHSRAVLLREELAFGGPHAPRLLFGLRHEQYHLDAADLPPGGSAWENQNAWDLQASYDFTPLLSIYAKAARSYRIDDDGYTSAGYRPLAGQLRQEREMGATWGNAARSLSLRVFSEHLRNEIIFDQSLGQQGYAGNLEPSRRDGLVLEAGMNLNRDWRIGGQAQQVNASFDDYPYHGQDIALVPKTLLSARLYWVPPGGASNADMGVQWLRALRYGSDFEQSCLAQVPAFATLDGHYTRKMGAWELGLSGSNLTNRRHYGDAPACRSSIYQNDARQLRVSLRYRF